MAESKSSIVLLVVFLFGIVGCSSTKDITRNPSNKTDFIVKDVYRLSKPVFLLAGSNSLMTSGVLGSSLSGDAKEHKLPSQAEAVLEAGTLLRVSKVVTRSNPMVGTITDVFAEVMTGSMLGRTVNLRTISKDDWTTGFTRRDQECLEHLGQSLK